MTIGSLHRPAFPRPPSPPQPLAPLTPKQVATYREMDRAISAYAAANVNLQPLGGLLERDQRRLSDSVFDARHPKGPLGLSLDTRKELAKQRAAVDALLASGKFGDRPLRPGEVEALGRVKFELGRLAALDASLRGAAAAAPAPGAAAALR